MFHHVDWLRGQTVFVRSSSSLLMFPAEWVQCLQQNSPGNSDLSHTHFCYPWKRNWRSWKIIRVAKLFYTYMQVYWFFFYNQLLFTRRRYQKKVSKSHQHIFILIWLLSRSNWRKIVSIIWKKLKSPSKSDILNVWF